MTPEKKQSRLEEYEAVAAANREENIGDDGVYMEDLEDGEILVGAGRDVFVVQT